MSEEVEVRQRRYMGPTSVVSEQTLWRPPLDFNLTRLPTERVLPDHLQLRFEHHWVRGVNSTQLWEFLDRLSRSEVLFNRPRRGLRTVVTKSGKPFLSGSRITFEQSRIPNNFKMIVDVKLNPTRYLAYRGVLQNDPEYFVRLDPNRRRVIKSTTLDKNDNFLFRHLSVPVNFLADDTSSNGEVTFLSLISDVTAWFEETINRYSYLNGFNVDFNWDRWSISQSEVYMEFYTPNAVAGMAKISRYIKMLYTSTEFRQYINPRLNRPSSTANNSNSFSIQIKLLHDFKLVIYSKSRDVIRFELRKINSLRDNLAFMNFELSDDEQAHLDQLTCSNARRTYLRNRVTTNRIGMARLLRITGNHLASIILDIFRAIRENPEEGEVNLELIPQFIRFLHDHIPNQQTANEIWTKFAADGFINLSDYYFVSLEQLNKSNFSDYMRVGEDDLVFLSDRLRPAMLLLRQDPNIGLIDESEDPS